MDLAHATGTSLTSELRCRHRGQAGPEGGGQSLGRSESKLQTALVPTSSPLALSLDKPWPWGPWQRRGNTCVPPGLSHVATGPS